MGYEKGERKEKGHLQGITRIYTHESLKDKIRAWMRKCLMLNTGMHRCKVGFSFFTGQEWEYMCGYVQKDMGKLFACYPPIEERTCHISFYSLYSLTFSRLLVSFIPIFPVANAVTHARTPGRSLARSLARPEVCWLCIVRRTRKKATY